MVRDLVREVALGAGFPEPTAAEVASAGQEAASNVIEHAYPGSNDARVEVWIDDRGDQLRIELRDSGRPIDPRSTHRGPPLEGVRLMERVMDSVTYRRSARRNVCCMLRRKPAAG
jgi:anti-sigma regulatory factor (Ser/Thr protein kinase)